MSPKREAELTHRIAALAFSMSHAFSELQEEFQIDTELKDLLVKLNVKMEQITENCFEVKEVSKSNYLVSLSNKIDTVIRKNFETITE